MRDLDDVLKHLLALPEEARAALAAELLESLDEDTDADAEQQWRDEVRRRVQAVKAGTAKTVPWSEVRAHLHGKRKKK